MVPLYVFQFRAIHSHENWLSTVVQLFAYRSEIRSRGNRNLFQKSFIEDKTCVCIECADRKFF